MENAFSLLGLMYFPFFLVCWVVWQVSIAFVDVADQDQCAPPQYLYFTLRMTLKHLFWLQLLQLRFRHTRLQRCGWEQMHPARHKEPSRAELRRQPCLGGVGRHHFDDHHCIPKIEASARRASALAESG